MTHPAKPRKASTPVERFYRNEDGTIIVTWAAALAVFMGFLALTFDFGRLSTTQSELQSYVDNVALAAAGELDGHDDAIIRATAAAEEMISDTQTFGDGATVLSGDTEYTLTFHTDKPGSDPSLTETTDPKEAAFVRAVSSGRNVDLGFASAFGALSGNDVMDNGVGAEAVAGFSQSTCDITPLMFCLPSAEFATDNYVGKVALLRTGGNGAGWGAGAFGWLNPDAGIVDPDGPCAGKSGGNLDACLIGAVGRRTSCFDTKSTVEVQGGQRVGNFEAAFNVRFDIYHSNMSNLKNNPLFAPAPNVISGYAPLLGKKQCLPENPLPSLNTVGLPVDDCFLTGACDRFGDGNWNLGRALYVTMNYGGIDPYPNASTRYEYYLSEIEGAGGASANLPILTGLAETGRPYCSKSEPAGADRRVLVAAGIDCVKNTISAGASVPVEAYFEIFMIKPIGLDGTKDFWVEIIGKVGGGAAGAGSNAVVRDVVKLYE